MEADQAVMIYTSEQDYKKELAHLKPWVLVYRGKTHNVRPVNRVSLGTFHIHGTPDIADVIKAMKVPPRPIAVISKFSSELRRESAQRAPQQF